jgi:predicted SAM-dependent methyltransferase
VDVPRQVLDGFGRLAAFLKRGRRVPVDGAMVKVNLGSALVVAPGWINVDASLNALIAGAPAPLLRLAYRWSGSRVTYSVAEYTRILRDHRFLHVNFGHGLPFEAATVDFVFASHLLEHLYLDEAARLLAEIHRVLKPGGWTRISVPDLEHAIRLYQRGDRARALQYFFSDSRIGQLNKHQYMYDFTLLSDALRQAGFAEVRRCTFRNGQVPDLEVLDNRPEESLYVEARKPQASGAAEQSIELKDLTGLG